MAKPKVSAEHEAYKSRGKKAAKAESVGSPKPYPMKDEYDRPMAKAAKKSHNSY